MNNDNLEPRDPRSYLRTVLTRWWLILPVVVIVTVGTYIYYDHKPKTYTASTQLLFQQSPLNEVLVGSGSGNSKSAVENLALLVQTHGIAQRAKAELEKEGHSPISGTVTAEQIQESDFIEISVSADTPDGAAALANAYAAAFVGTQSGRLKGEAEQTLLTMRKQLGKIPVETSGGALQRSALQEQMRALQLIIAQPVRSAGLSQVQPARPPSSPISPHPTRNAIFAFIVSLLLAIAACFGLEYLDRKLKTVEGAEQAFNLPVLTEVPQVSDPAPADEAGRAGLAHDLHEPFHRLQTNIEMLSLERPVRTLLVVSAAPDEGKSLVIRNLAIAYREAGRRIAVVDADFRKAALGRLLEAEEGPGLTDILMGRASFEDALQVVTPAAVVNGNGSGSSRQRVARRTAVAGEGEISMVPAGSHPQDQAPPSYAELSRALNIVPQTYETVIIDSAAVLAAADVLPLLSAADGVLIVTRLGVSTRDSAKRLLTEIERVPNTRIVGVVVNGIPQRLYKTRAYGYYYGY
jgi:Mrp family chromosome partitioning ATPase